MSAFRRTVGDNRGLALIEALCFRISDGIVGKPHLTPSELEPDSLGRPAMPLAKRAFFSTSLSLRQHLFKPPVEIFGTYRPSLSQNEVLAAKHRYDGVQRGGPVLFRGLLVVAGSFDIQAHREPFLRPREVDHRR